MKKIVLFCLLSIFAVVSCAPVSSSRYREGSNAGQTTNLTVQDERRLTKEALPKIQKDYPAANNPELQKYISDLGLKIVRANNLEGNPYSYNFTVVDVKDVNAFAMPAGTVFVTAPLIALASNEAELAGVVAHEIGHVEARHTAKRMYAMEQAQNKTWMYATGGAVLGAALGYGLGMVVCAKGDTACQAKAALAGAALGAGGGLLAQKYTFLVNSREDEMEADRLGFKYSVGAGYDKDQVGGGLQDEGTGRRREGFLGDRRQQDGGDDKECQVGLRQERRCRAIRGGKRWCSGHVRPGHENNL